MVANYKHLELFKPKVGRQSSTFSGDSLIVNTETSTDTEMSFHIPAVVATSFISI